MFNLIDIYICIQVSGCIGRGPLALLCPGAYNSVKTALSLPFLPKLSKFHMLYCIMRRKNFVYRYLKEI